MDHPNRNPTNNDSNSNNISSIDYFLLDDNNNDSSNVAALSSSVSSRSLKGGRSMLQNQRQQVVEGTATNPVDVTTLSQQELQRDEDDNEHAALLAIPNNGSNSNAVDGNRCRLDSHNTNTSCVTSNSPTTYGNDINSNNNHTVVERIYFDDDAMIGNGTISVTSTNRRQLQRGESTSSYSVLLESSSPTTTPITSPLLQGGYEPGSIVSHTGNTTSGNTDSHHRRRTWSNSSEQRRYRRQQRRRNRDVPELSGLNILNAITYSVHIIIWWTIGVWGLHHILYTHWEQTKIHETLITPSTFAAHYLWVPIMITEAIFTIAQLLPNYRARPIITSGTSYFFFYTVLLQISYTVLYSFGLFVFSFICIVLALVALLSLLASQQYHSTADDHITSTTSGGTMNNSFSGNGTTGLFRTLSVGGGTMSMVGTSHTNGRWLCSYRMVEYVLFTFPFYLHTGWLILMAVEHYSLLFRRYNSPIDAQLAADIVGLGVLFLAAMYSLTQNGYPDFVIPTVVMWSYGGIAWRLSYPSDTMVNAYGLIAIGSIRIASFCFLGAVGCCMIPQIVICLSREFCTINVVEIEL